MDGCGAHRTRPVGGGNGTTNNPWWTRLRTTVLVGIATVVISMGILTPVEAVATGSEFTVCPAGRPACDFATVQEALSDLAVDPGDVISVRPGVYAEPAPGPVEMSKAGLRLRATDPGAAIVLDTIVVSADDARVEGFHVDGANGVAVEVRADDAVLIANTVHGGVTGVRVTTGSVTMTGNSFAGNAEHVVDAAPNMTGVDIDDALEANTFDRATATRRATGFAQRRIFASLAQGLAAATNPGDAVEVLSGTYTESPVISQDVTVRSRGGASTTAVSGALTIAAGGAGATIDGLAITGAVAVAVGADNVTLLRSRFGSSVTIAAGSVNVDVRDNVFDGDVSVALSHGADDSEISGNTFFGTSADVAIDGRGAGTKIVSNALAAAAISAAPTDPAAAIRVNSTANGTTIERNDVRHNDVGVMIAPGATGARIISNELRTNRIGILVEAGAGPDAVARFNNIVGNSEWGARTGGGVPLDARENWWGAAGGPAHPNNPVPSALTGNPVTGSVVFLLWCAAEGCPGETLVR